MSHSQSHRRSRWFLPGLTVVVEATLLLAFAGTVVDITSYGATTNTSGIPNGALTSTNRLTVAVLAFECQPTRTILEPCRSVEQHLALTWLKESTAIRVLPNASVAYALQQTRLIQNTRTVETQEQKLGQLLGAQRLVLVSFQPEGGKWSCTARLFNVSTGATSKDFNASSTNMLDVMESLTDHIFQELQITPSESKSRRPRARGAGSTIAWEWCGKAWALASEGKTAAEQENCYRNAIEADRQFAAAYDQLAALLASQGKWQEAEKIAGEALNLDSADVYAHRILAASLWAHGKDEQAEKELRTVTRLDPDDADAFAHVGYLCLAKGQLSEAIAACECAARLDPCGQNAAFVHAQLGHIYAQQGDRNRAITHLLESERMAASDDMLVEQILANALIGLKETKLAVVHCGRFIELAKKQGAFPGQVRTFERFLTEAKSRQTPAYLTIASPKNYTKRTLHETLSRKLTGNQIPLAVDPLASTARMSSWAHQLTKGATNNTEQAEMLFDVLSQRTASGGRVPYASSLSAEELFAKWHEPGFLMQCQQVTFLYVALARSIGIAAYAVNVQEAWDGDRSPHACAAVFIGGNTLLVDPSCSRFGVAHRRFTVLDDLQAIAVHLCMQTDLERNRIAVKLAPELALVQARLCGNLINLGCWTEAAKLLPTVLRLDTTGAWSAALQAAFALHNGQTAQAESLLRQGLRIDPWNSGLHFQLGNAYAAKGRLKEARDSYANALRCPHTDEEAERLNHAIARLSDADRPNGLRHED